MLIKLVDFVKKHLKKYETIGTRIVQLLLCLLVLIRVLMVYKASNSCDLDNYLTVAKVIRGGISPYSHNIWSMYKIAPPLQPPSMSLLVMPLTFHPEHLVHVLFFISSALFFYALVFFVFNHYGYSPKEYIKPKWSNLPVWLTLAMVCTSTPIGAVLWAGQNSSFAALCLFAVLLYPKKDILHNSLLLGLAAAIKYSLLTMFVPVILLQKRWKMGILAFGIFIVLVSSIVFWLDGLVTPIVDYVSMIIKDTNSGCNSYSNPNPAFLFIGFF